MIRPAEPADMLRLLRMARRHMDMIGMDAPFDEQSGARYFAGLILGESSTILVSDGGMIGGAVGEFPFAPTWRVAVEHFWFAEDGSGRPLLRAFRAWAREKGANEMRICTHLGFRGGVGAILKREGMTMDEHVYRETI